MVEPDDMGLAGGLGRMEPEPADPMDREAITLQNTGKIPVLTASQAKRIRDEAVADYQRHLSAAADVIEVARQLTDALLEELDRYQPSGPGKASPGPEEEVEGGTEGTDTGAEPVGAVPASLVDLTSGGFALRHEALTVPPVHIPDGQGGAYKTELVVERSPERTIKYLWWHAPDPRPEPHNHPWDFTSEILHGGYTEDRYWLEWDGVDLAVEHEQRSHRAGDVNHVTRNVFHSVIAVQPGTVTRMTCGPAVPGNEWSYLDTSTGETKPSGDPNFRRQLEAINPHLRPETEPIDRDAEAIARMVLLLDRAPTDAAIAGMRTSIGGASERALADPMNWDLVDRWYAAVRGVDR